MTATEGSDEPRRFPRRVYDHGHEPDPRFSLANERTFLAWIRTALAIMAVGVAMEAFGVPEHPTVRTIAAGAALTLGVATCVHAWWAWVRVERALRLGGPLPGSGMGLVVAAVLAAFPDATVSDVRPIVDRPDNSER